MTADVQSGRRFDTPEAFSEAFGVSRETLDGLKTYERLLKQWQSKINLVSPATLDHVWHRHFADSAQLLPLAPAAALRWVDLGSGAGFPGLVVAIMLKERPGARVRLIESDSRKAAFLAEVARHTGAPVDILGGRIEKLSTHDRVEATDVVTARALAPLPRLLDFAAPLFGQSTLGLFAKGRDYEIEIAAARGAWQFSIEAVPSRTDPEGHIVMIRDLEAKTEG